MVEIGLFLGNRIDLKHLLMLSAETVTTVGEAAVFTFQMSLFHLLKLFARQFI